MKVWQTYWRHKNFDLSLNLNDNCQIKVNLSKIIGKNENENYLKNFLKNTVFRSSIAIMSKKLYPQTEPKLKSKTEPDDAVADTNI